MNNCVFVGRLTHDPEIRYVNNEEQLAVARMSIAVDRPVRKGEEKKADFFRCVCFGHRAEFAANYLKKGKRIAVQGRMQNESFTAADGSKIKYMELVTNEINFADGKDEGEKDPLGKNTGKENATGKAGTGKTNAPGTGRNSSERTRTKQADQKFEAMPEEDEDLPFH